MKIKKIIPVLALLFSVGCFMGCDEFDDVNTATVTPTINNTSNNIEPTKNEVNAEEDTSKKEDNISNTTDGANVENTDNNRGFLEGNNVSVATVTPQNTKESKNDENIVEEDKTSNEEKEPEKNHAGENGSNGIRSWICMENLAKETFDEINKYRKENGVNELKWNEEEWEKANKRALENVQEEKGGHEFEQISIVTGCDSTAIEFLSRWQNSPSHNKFLLNTTEEEGAVAVYKDNNNIYYIVASFTDNWGKGQDIGVVPFGNF